nr:LysR family transcriptional regulator [Catenulispora pinisilvae]
MMDLELRSLRYFAAVAEELHFGRAARRLHMTQPPLSRAIRQLEADLGVALFERSPSGVALTPVGVWFYQDARALLDQADRLRAKAAAAAGAATLTVGMLSDGSDADASRLVKAFRERHPHVDVQVREADLADPTCGLRSGLVDVALTHGPFDETGISVRRLRTDPVGAVLRSDDPLADRKVLRLAELADRRWFRLPESADPLWRAFWNATTPQGPMREGPIVRTVQECLQAVLWNGTIGLAPRVGALPPGLTFVPLADAPPTTVVVAWAGSRDDPLVRSFVRVAAQTYGAGTGS